MKYKNNFAVPERKKRPSRVFVHRRNKIIVISVFTLAVTVVLAMPFLRSETSVTEKRELTKFPHFSFSSLFDGSFFDGVGLWFSDTVPARDTLTAADHRIRNLLGTAGVEAGFAEGEAGDDIPEPGHVLEDEPTADQTEPTEVQSAQSTETETSEIQTTSPAPTEPQTDEEFTGVSETLGTVIIADNAGFEYYNFVQETADKYIRAVNRAGNSLAGQTKVYCMIVPLSSDITLNSHVRDKLNVSDQKAASDYMLGSMNENVGTVPIFDTLKAHRDEYIYFRTDHHWTGLGAYYAYREFCAASGKTAVPLNDYELRSYDGFLGTFYNDSGQSPALAATPDRVDTYYPPCQVTMTVTDRNGNTSQMPLIYDESKSTLPSVKYSAFISGDNSFTVINNLDKEDGDTLVVVKESFGNALVPLLPPHYKTIYVIDYRYWYGNITQFCRDKGADELLFCNNISMTRSKSLVEAMDSEIS